MEQDQSETDVAENELFKQQTTNNLCTLHDIPEGQIGKLIRYKSGKMKLLLGNGHFYDITHGIDSTYLQVCETVWTICILYLLFLYFSGSRFDNNKPRRTQWKYCQPRQS